MAVNALLAMGARIYDSPDGIVFTEMVDMQKIGTPSQPTVNMIAVNSVNPTGRAEEFLPGLIKYGEFEFEQYYSASRLARHRGRLSLIGSVTTYYRIVLPDQGPNTASKFEFAGYLMEAKLSDFEVEKPMVIMGKVKITLFDTFTPAT